MCRDHFESGWTSSGTSLRKTGWRSQRPQNCRDGGWSKVKCFRFVGWRFLVFSWIESCHILILDNARCFNTHTHKFATMQGWRMHIFQLLCPKHASKWVHPAIKAHSTFQLTQRFQFVFYAQSIAVHKLRHPVPVAALDPMQLAWCQPQWFPSHLNVTVSFHKHAQMALIRCSSRSCVANAPGPSIPVSFRIWVKRTWPWVHEE